MQTIQFTATPQDEVIPIPPEYQAQAQGEVQVIVLLCEDNAVRRKHRFLDSIHQHKFELPADYQFNRDRLHER